MMSPGNYQPSRKLPIEFALAVACCRWTYSGEGADDVRGRARTADWGAFLQTCRRHRVQGLAWHALSGLDVRMPPPVQVALSADARAIAEHGLRAAHESARLAAAFRDAALPLLFLKGLPVGSLAYGNAFLKMSSDIDLLVDPAKIEPAAAVLRDLGYRLELPSRALVLGRWHLSRKESVWRGTGNLVVELHSRVADQPQLLPAIGVATASQEVEIAPGIALATFAAEELFAYLCVHGASSAWFRLKWITDVAAVLRDQRSQDLDRLHSRALQLAAGGSVAQALILADELFGLALSPALREQIRTPVNRWLASTALGAMLDGEPTQRPLGTARIHLTQFFLLPGFGFKLAELRRQARVAAGMF